VSEAAGITGAHLLHPNLGVRVPGEEPIRGSHLVPVYLVICGLDVDEGVLPFILGAEVWPHLALVELVAAPGHLLQAVAALP
jgi:hypothetical protein